MAEGDFITSWAAPGSSGVDVTSDGNFIWVVDRTDNKVYKQNMSGGNINSWNTVSNPRGVCTDGVSIWVGQGGSSGLITRYNMAGTMQDSWSDSGRITDHIRGMTTDGTDIWITMGAATTVFQYTQAGTFITSWDGEGGSNEGGVGTDGNFIWVADAIADDVNKFDMDGNLDTAGDWSLTGANDRAFGMDTYPDSTKFWVADFTDNIIYVYEHIPVVTALNRKIKISGTFQDKPIKTKVSGTFVDKPIKIKVGGTFQDA